MTGFQGASGSSRTSLAIALAALGLSFGDTAGQDWKADVDPTSLLGSWSVDLRPTPDAPEYLQEFLVTNVADGRLEGVFYGSRIEEGRLNTDWGLVRFAFVTRDDSSVYHTSGTLENGRLEGMTHSPGREFLSVWTAEPTPRPGPTLPLSSP